MEDIFDDVVRAFYGISRVHFLIVIAVVAFFRANGRRTGHFEPFVAPDGRKKKTIINGTIPIISLLLSMNVVES